MAMHLLDGLYEGVRATESAMRQREHLVQLGHLSANLAHELNNPAAAAVRATEQLRGRMGAMRHKLGLLADGGLPPELVARLVKCQEAAVERAMKPRPDLTALEESDLEDAIAERLDEVGVDDAYDLAPVFATAGMDAAWVDDVVEQVDSGARVERGLRLAAYTLETETLMSEIEEAATRISSLVGAVKQYSHMDQAQHQDLDVKPGIESTLVMLARKLNGHRGRPGVRPHAAAGPRLPGRAEPGVDQPDRQRRRRDGRHGVLTLRTHADPDAVFVEIADDGPGVPEEVRDRLFEPFVTTKPTGEGSGLGLENAAPDHRAPARRVAELHDRAGGNDLLRPAAAATARG